MSKTVAVVALTLPSTARSAGSEMSVISRRPLPVAVHQRLLPQRHAHGLAVPLGDDLPRPLRYRNAAHRSPRPPHLDRHGVAGEAEDLHGVVHRPVAGAGVDLAGGAGALGRDDHGTLAVGEYLATFGDRVPAALTEELGRVSRALATASTSPRRRSA